jgi:hypothetical protein
MLYLRNHPPEGFHAIFVDVEGFDHPSQFITEVMTELSRRLPRIQRALRSFAGLPDQLRNLLRETFSDIEVADFKVGLRQLLQKGWRDTGHDLLQLVRQVGDPIVLLADAGRRGKGRSGAISLNVAPTFSTTMTACACTMRQTRREPPWRCSPLWPARAR